VTLTILQPRLVVNMAEPCENPYICKPAYAVAKNPDECNEVPCIVAKSEPETEEEIIEPNP